MMNTVSGFCPVSARKKRTFMLASKKIMKKLRARNDRINGNVVQEAVLII